jgi:hypothetical protein
MTKEDIIRMAHEAGLHLATDVNWMPIIDLKYAQKFANLVAAAEREACAKVAERYEPDEKTSYVTYASSAIRARGEK